MSWPGLILRLSAFGWFLAALGLQRLGLSQLGITPALTAKVAWCVLTVLPVWLLMLLAAKRVDHASSDKWKIWS